MSKDPFAVTLGTRGGSRRSEAKTAAARRNWKRAVKALREKRAKARKEAGK